MYQTAFIVEDLEFDVTGQIIGSPDVNNPFLRIEIGEIKSSVTQVVADKAVHQLSLRLAFLSYVAHLLCPEVRGDLLGFVYIREGTFNRKNLDSMIANSVVAGNSIVNLAPGFHMKKLSSAFV